MADLLAQLAELAAGRTAAAQPGQHQVEPAGTFLFAVLVLLGGEKGADDEVAHQPDAVERVLRITQEPLLLLLRRGGGVAGGIQDRRAGGDGLVQRRLQLSAAELELFFRLPVERGYLVER